MKLEVLVVLLVVLLIRSSFLCLRNFEWASFTPGEQKVTAILGPHPHLSSWRLVPLP